MTLALVALCNLAPIQLTTEDILHYKADTNRCYCHIPSRHTGFTPIREGRYHYYKCRKHRRVYQEEIQTAARLILILLAFRGFKQNPQEVEVDPLFMEHEIAHQVIAIPIPQTCVLSAFLNWEGACHCAWPLPSRTHHWVCYDKYWYNHCCTCGLHVTTPLIRWQDNHGYH